MKSLVSFVLRFNLDFLSVLIIGDECRGIEDKCALNRAANLLPRVLFIVELESHDKYDHLLNVYTHMSCLFQSLQIVWATRRINFEGNFPYAYEKMVFSRNIYLVWSVDD